MSVVRAFSFGMNFRRLVAAAVIMVAAPLAAETPAPVGPAVPVANPVAAPTAHVEHREPLVDLLAIMSGKCTTLKIAGRDFTCKAVAYAHSEEGRVNFAVALNDPSDDSHVVYFSGTNGKRFDDNSYELPVDRMLLNSKHRPKLHGLPVPSAEASSGLCRQVGNFAAHKVSSITCNSTDTNGRRYELVFESDGSPISVRRVRQSAPTAHDPFR